MDRIRHILAALHDCPKIGRRPGRQTDAALFSGKRMDDDEEITYTALGVAAAPSD